MKLILRHRSQCLVFAVFAVVCAIAFVPRQAFAQDDPAAAAIEFFNAGQDAHEKRDLRKAIEQYQNALKQLPEFPEAEHQLGTAFAELGNSAEAEAAFRRAIALREDWTLPMVALGLLLVRENRFTEALPVLNRVIEIDDQSSPAYAALAELHLRTNAAPEKLKELLGPLRALSAKAKPTASIWIARAAIERALGDTGNARVSIAKALAIEPSSRAAIAERAEISIMVNDFANAVADAEYLVKQATTPGIQYLLARAYAADGRTADALRTIDSIVARNDEMNRFRDRLMTAASENASELEKRLESDPKNPALLGRLCVINRTADPQRALDFCRRAYELEPKNIEHVIGFGAALVQAKQFETAVSLLTRVASEAPDNFTARANLAVALFQLKRLPEAKTQYEWLTGRQPDLAPAYYFLAIIHDQLKEYIDAMANYQRFLKLADAEQFKLEIEKVNLRLPILQKQIKKKD